MKKIAFIFPGQGSQSVGMGKDFYDNSTAAREVFQEGDELLKRSVSKVAFEGPVEELTQTRNSQTAIYLNSMAVLRAIQEQFPGLEPIVCAGHSLGEYSALSASRRLAFADCLPLVQFRAEAMNEACLQHKGAMAAIIGLSGEQVQSVVDQVDQLWAANFNCPGQVVISGSAGAVEKGMALAKEAGAKLAMPLKVHGAFHSGLMQSAEEKLSPKIHETTFAPSEVGLIMNVVGDYVSDSESIKKNLASQVTSPVRWEQGIKKMEGVELFVEIGAGKVLAGLNKKIGIKVPTLSIGKVSDLELLAEGITQ